MMSSVDSLDEAVLMAVRAYRLARKRGALQKDSANGHRRIGRKEIEDLARDFPEAYSMKDKNLIKTTESIESTSNVKLIDELREEEEKLIATRTTTKEDK